MSDHPTSETPDEGEPLSVAPSGLREMCITAQTRAARSGTIDAIRPSAGRITTMLFTIAFLVAVSTALIIHKARVAGRGAQAQANLGWMSAQWLAEHRSSHPS